MTNRRPRIGPPPSDALDELYRRELAGVLALA